MKTVNFRHNGKRKSLVVLKNLFGVQRVPLVAVLDEVNRFNETHQTGLCLVSPFLAYHALNHTPVQTRDTFEGTLFPSDVVVAFDPRSAELGREIVVTGVPHYDGTIEPKVSNLVLHTGKYAGSRWLALAIPKLKRGELVPDGDNLVLAVPDSRLVPIHGFPFGVREHDCVLVEPGVPVVANKQRTMVFLKANATDEDSPHIGYLHHSCALPAIPFGNAGSADGRRVLLDSQTASALVLEVPRKDLEKVASLPDG